MKIYKPQGILIRVIISDTNTAEKNIIKFSIAESTCLEVCALIEKTIPGEILPTTRGYRNAGKERSVKIDVSELDSTDGKLRKVSRTINVKGMNATDVAHVVIEAVNAAERLELPSINRTTVSPNDCITERLHHPNDLSER